MEIVGIIIGFVILIILFPFRKKINKAVDLSLSEWVDELERKRDATLLENKARRKLLKEKSDALGDVPTADELLSELLNKSGQSRPEKKL